MTFCIHLQMQNMLTMNSRSRCEFTTWKQLAIVLEQGTGNIYIYQTHMCSTIIMSKSFYTCVSDVSIQTLCERAWLRVILNLQTKCLQSLTSKINLDFAMQYKFMKATCEPQKVYCYAVVKPFSSHQALASSSGRSYDSKAYTHQSTKLLQHAQFTQH